MNKGNTETIFLSPFILPSARVNGERKKKLKWFLFSSNCLFAMYVGQSAQVRAHNQSGEEGEKKWVPYY